MRFFPALDFMFLLKNKGMKSKIMWVADSCPPNG